MEFLKQILVLILLFLMSTSGVFSQLSSQIEEFKAFVGYNESCSNSLICNTKKNLICYQEICICKSDTLTYVTDTEGCEPKITFGESGDCLHDAQCQQGSWGQFSRCNKTTAKCSCHNTTHGEENIQFQNTSSDQPHCIAAKLVGQSCQTDIQCSILERKAFCSKSKVCECEPGYVSNGHKCRLNIWTGRKFNCDIDEQCQSSPLGILSKCDKTEWAGRCKCWDEGNPGDNNVARSKTDNRCYKVCKQDSKCEDDEDCVFFEKNGTCEKNMCMFNGSHKCHDDIMESGNENVASNANTNFLVKSYAWVLLILAIVSCNF